MPEFPECVEGVSGWEMELVEEPDNDPGGNEFVSVRTLLAEAARGRVALHITQWLSSSLFKP
jgi:hypothetical protein